MTMNQAALDFGPTPEEFAWAKQRHLDLGLGDRWRDRMLDRLRANGWHWVRTMQEIARHLSGVNGGVTSDDLRAVALTLGLEPHHRNAWGAVFHGKRWVCIGRQKSALPTNHGREIKVWAWRG